MKVVKINNKIITASIDSHGFLSKTFAELISSLGFLTFVSFLHKGVFEIWDCSKWITDKAQTSFLP